MINKEAHYLTRRIEREGGNRILKIYKKRGMTAIFEEDSFEEELVILESEGKPALKVS